MVGIFFTFWYRHFIVFKPVNDSHTICYFWVSQMKGWNYAGQQRWCLNHLYINEGMIANFITFLVILAADIVNLVWRYGWSNFCTLLRYDRERKKRRNGVGILPITGPLCYFFLPRKRNRLYTYCNFTKK